jgi:superfamily II helicase
MDTTARHDNVDYRLLGLISELVICSACLRQGRVTPVPQIVSHRHTPRSLCRSCAKPRRRNLRRVLTHLVQP